MTERPIIFSGSMVRAIIEGRKSQTRRLVTAQTSECGAFPTRRAWPHLDFSRAYVDGKEKGSEYLHAPLVADAEGQILGEPAPSYDGCWDRIYPRIAPERCWDQTPDPEPGVDYVPPASRLWVRETFTLESCHEVGWYEPPYADDRPLRTHQHPDDGTWWEQPHYRATDPPPELSVDGVDGPGCRWIPSIFMPRWASRITLEVTEVRAQRLQDISEEDALAEGVAQLPPGPSFWAGEISGSGKVCYANARTAFEHLWDSINGKRAPWASNPFVWAITFQKINP